MLVSWAVPKGPTLDPDVRRMAVHVEDHPLDYFDFEGVIPAGEYGGGDVIVWDWGTWALAEADDPLEAIAAGNVHVDLARREAAGPVRARPWRRSSRPGGGDRRATRTGCCSRSTTRPRSPVGIPEDHPRSVKTGRTNDEVKDAPAASWSSTAIWAAPTADELAALDALGQGGASGRSASTRCKLTNLDKVLFPGRGGGPPVTEARPDPPQRRRRRR